MYSAKFWCTTVSCLSVKGDRAVRNIGREEMGWVDNNNAGIFFFKLDDNIWNNCYLVQHWAYSISTMDMMLPITCHMAKWTGSTGFFSSFELSMTFHFLWNEINMQWKWTQSDGRTFMNNAMDLLTKLPATKKNTLDDKLLYVVTSIFFLAFGDMKRKSMKNHVINSTSISVVGCCSSIPDTGFLSKVDSIRM